MSNWSSSLAVNLGLKYSRETSLVMSGTICTQIVTRTSLIGVFLKEVAQVLEILLSGYNSFSRRATLLVQSRALSRNWIFSKSRNRFLSVQSHFHVTDNKNLEQGNKVAPLQIFEWQLGKTWKFSFKVDHNRVHGTILWPPPRDDVSSLGTKSVVVRTKWSLCGIRGSLFFTDTQSEEIGHCEAVGWSLNA